MADKSQLDRGGLTDRFDREQVLTEPKPLPTKIAKNAAELSAAAEELRCCQVIALDTESNSRHHYPEQLCLIQIASPEKIYIIDTIAIADLSPLRAILASASIKKIIHSADYDVRCLDRRDAFSVSNLTDPSIAARFCGITQYGLAHLAKGLLGITMNKSERLQKSDWARRPLSAEAIAYAADDVRYLATLQAILDEKLKSLGRAEWVAEEYARIEQVRHHEPNPETAYLAVKGSKDLNGQPLAIFRQLFLFREAEARRLRRPPFFIMPDSTLIYLAENPQADLAKAPGLGPSGLNRFGGGLKKALGDGLKDQPVYRPPHIRTKHATDEEAQRLARLKEWRIEMGAKFALDPSLIWHLGSLERLAKAPDTLDAESRHDSIRQWQCDVVAPHLRTFLAADSKKRRRA